MSRLMWSQSTRSSNFCSRDTLYIATWEKAGYSVRTAGSHFRCVNRNTLEDSLNSQRRGSLCVDNEVLYVVFLPFNFSLVSKFFTVTIMIF